MPFLPKKYWGSPLLASYRGSQRVKIGCSLGADILQQYGNRVINGQPLHLPYMEKFVGSSPIPPTQKPPRWGFVLLLSMQFGFLASLRRYNYRGNISLTRKVRTIVHFKAVKMNEAGRKHKNA
jgi:hypothetical protein